MSADIRELLRGTSFAAIHHIVGLGTAFLVSVLLARFLGASGLGVFALAATTTTIAGIVGRVGLDMAMLRFASAAAYQDDWYVVSGVYRAGMRIALLASGAATAALMLLAPILSHRLFDDPAAMEPTRIMALTILPTTVAILHGEMLKALKLTGVASFVLASAPPSINLVVLGIAALSIKGGFNPTQATWAALLAGIIVSATAMWLWRRHTPQLRNLRGSFEIRRLLGTSLPLFWVASMSLIISATDIVMLGIWTTSEEVALYSAALKLSALVGFPLVAINAIATPQLSGFYATNDHKRMELVARGATLFAGLLALLISALFWIAPKLVLGVFGQEFTAAALALVIITVGRFIHSATGPVGVLLIATGREKLLRNFVAAAALANIALNILLIPRYGIEGAAIASALSLAGMKISILYFVNRKLKISTIPVPWIQNRNP